MGKVYLLALVYLLVDTIMGKVVDSKCKSVSSMQYPPIYTHTHTHTLTHSVTRVSGLGT